LDKKQSHAVLGYVNSQSNLLLHEIEEEEKQKQEEERNHPYDDHFMDYSTFKSQYQSYLQSHHPNLTSSTSNEKEMNDIESDQSKHQKKEEELNQEKNQKEEEEEEEIMKPNTSPKQQQQKRRKKRNQENLSTFGQSNPSYAHIKSHIKSYQSKNKNKNNKNITSHFSSGYANVLERQTTKLVIPRVNSYHQQQSQTNRPPSSSYSHIPTMKGNHPSSSSSSSDALKAGSQVGLKSLLKEIKSEDIGFSRGLDISSLPKGFNSQFTYQQQSLLMDREDEMINKNNNNHEELKLVEDTNNQGRTELGLDIQSSSSSSSSVSEKDQESINHQPHSSSKNQRKRAILRFDDEEEMISSSSSSNNIKSATIQEEKEEDENSMAQLSLESKISLLQSCFYDMEVPISHQLEFVLKYSSPFYSSHLITSIGCWSKFKSLFLTFWELSQFWMRWKIHQELINEKDLSNMLSQIDFHHLISPNVLNQEDMRNDDEKKMKELLKDSGWLKEEIYQLNSKLDQFLKMVSSKLGDEKLSYKGIEIDHIWLTNHIQKLQLEEMEDENIN